MNFALASVGNNGVQEDRTQNHERRELRGAPLLAASCAREQVRYVSEHGGKTPDADRAQFLL